MSDRVEMLEAALDLIDEGVAILDERPPRRRRALLFDWRRAEGLDE